MKQATETTTRREQKVVTRDRLVNAAMVLFARKGIVNTTTADVAKSIRMSHGTVFLHFPKRDDLVIAVIDEFGRRLSAEFRRAFEHDLGLRAVLQAHLRVLEEFEPFYARLVTEAPMLPAKVRSTLMLLHAAVSYELFTALERERKAGARKIDRPLLFNTWIGLVHHYLVNRDVFATGSSVIAEQGETLVNHFMTLVKP
jgi:AcrR family transcriptional regulator